MIDRLQGGAFVRRDRLHRRAIGRVHREDGIVHTGKSGSLLNRLLDARLGTEVHPLAAALLNGADLILKAKHGTPHPTFTHMYVFAAYISTKD
ncbi:hypothetical protein J2Y58_003626 [Sphingomonas sp. BE138]|nr:hypothetical protein [Sphingomonas sp. BE138]